MTDGPKPDAKAATQADPEAAGTDATASSAETSRQPDGQSIDIGSISRRGALATPASLGLMGAASESASAHHSGHDHLGETWSGDPGGRGLEFDLGSGTDVALFGQSSGPGG